MANFIKVGDNKYKIEGVLNSGDIKWINSLENSTLIIAENTIGMTSEFLNNITSECVMFSVKGGLDYETKKKYDDERYIKRTMFSPKGLVKILTYFEYNEKFLDPNWTERQTAMFLYNALAVDIDYEEKYDEVLNRGIMERSMNGILFGKLVCSGYALTFHEMMTRVGIKSYYQNKRNSHSFNVINVDNKLLGVDITWDSYNRNKLENMCPFLHFGTDENFYNNKSHSLYIEKPASDKNFFDFENYQPKFEFDNDETKLELTAISKDDVINDLKVIASAINNRKKAKYDINTLKEEKKWEYLPVDIVRKKLNKESIDILKYLDALILLAQNDMLSLTEADVAAARKIYAIYADVRGRKDIFNENIASELLSDVQRSKVYGLSIEEEEKIRIKAESVNEELSNFLDNYLKQCLDEINTLTNNYYRRSTNDFDENKKIKNAIIYSKLNFISLSKNRMLKIGINEELISQILSKINLVLTPEKHEIKKHPSGIENLEVILSDIEDIKKRVVEKIGENISDHEFFSTYYNSEYLMQLFDLASENLGVKKEDFDMVIMQYITKKDLSDASFKQK